MKKIKILKTNSYGAGWATWNTSNSDVADYMLTYQPIIEYLENLNPKPGWRESNGLDEKHPLVLQLVKEVKEKFGVNYICVLGAEHLEVDEAFVGGLVDQVRLSDFDGWERID